MAQDPMVEIRVAVSDLSMIRGLEIDFGCVPSQRQEDGTIFLRGLARRSTIAKLRRTGARFVASVAELDAAALPGVKELVSQTDRYSRGVLPRGPGSRRG